jgi:hypothetical protein
MFDRPRRARRMACALACASDPRSDRAAADGYRLPAVALIAIRHCRPAGRGWL